WVPSVLFLRGSHVLRVVPPPEALMEPEICYVLDAILFLYGIVLTGLYCHLKVSGRRPVHGPGRIHIIADGMEAPSLHRASGGRSVQVREHPRRGITRRLQ
uniref:Uncharacterized protein n=1 Tax=Nothoprocta perdicaria TaxID=30464 RepID=A0A8C7EAH8_NOTPE